jgi:hypothetical protein
LWVRAFVVVRRGASGPRSIMMQVMIRRALATSGPQWSDRRVGSAFSEVHMVLTLSSSSLSTAGVLLITIVGVGYGGTFMLRVVGGRVPTTDFQKAYFRAGHAHAGVLVILSLLACILVDATDLDGAAEFVARYGVPAAAVLMPSGFFFSAIGRGRTTPNQFVVLIWLGAASLATGVLALGFGLLAAA